MNGKKTPGTATSIPPEWAPPKLVEYRQFLIDGTAGGRARPSMREELRVIDKLLSDEKMAAVFSAVERRFTPASQSQLMDPVIRLARAVGDESRLWNATPKLTKPETDQLYRKVGGLAAELAKLINQTASPSLDDIASYMDHEAVPELAVRLSANTHAYKPEWAEMTVYAVVPTLSEILEHVAKHRSLPGQGTVLPQPNSAKARIHHFCRYFSNYFSLQCGLPLHKHVATLANVVLGASESAGSVRGLYRQMKKAQSAQSIGLV